MYDVNVFLDIFSISVTILVIIHLVTSEERKQRLNRLFLLMLAFNVAVLSCDTIVYTLMGTHYGFSRIILKIANFGVYSFGYCLVTTFTAYLVTFLASKGKTAQRLETVMFGLCVIAVGLVLLSQFNHIYYHYDADNIYRRGNWYWLSQAYPIGMMAANSIVVLRNRKILKSPEVIALLSYQIFPVIAMTIQIFVYGITLLYISTTFSLLIIYVSVQMEQSRRLKEQEVELLDSQISIMLSQIQPHFLYNSLTAIAYLCDIDPKKARQAIFQFSRYLRVNTDSLTTKFCIPFEKELEHVKNYLALEQMRFEDELRIQYDIRFKDFSLPPLTLQPLVENAVRYGVSKKEGGGTVIICTQEQGDQVTITVRDDGIGFDPKTPPPRDGRKHLGVENVRCRLERMCDGELELQSVPGIGTTVTIHLPKRNTETD